MAAGFGINRFQLLIKYISWMAGFVPLVSQTATAGGEAGVGVCVAALGRGGGRWDTAEFQQSEVPAPLWGTRGSQKLNGLLQRGPECEVSKYNNGKQ